MILLASVLKPIDDTRMYEKFALTLAEEHEVFVAGHKAAVPGQHPRIHFYPIYDPEEQGGSRQQAGAKLIRLMKEVRPQAVIIHAIELLPRLSVYCWMRGIPLFYDIQENYARNFWFQPVYPWYLRPFMALATRGLEWATSPLIRGYFLAERSYALELPFTKGKRLVLENKAVFPPGLSPSLPGDFPVRLSTPVKMLYMGTISEVYGIREAISWCAQASQFLPLTLTVVGHCGSEPLREWVYAQERKYPWLHLEGISRLVPHADILEAIGRHDLALLPYRPNPSTSRCIPTKLYECLSMGLPMLVQANPLWENQTRPDQAALFTDFSAPPSPKELGRLLHAQFYPNGLSDRACWNGQPLLEWIRIGN